MKKKIFKLLNALGATTLVVSPLAALSGNTINQILNNKSSDVINQNVTVANNTIMAGIWDFNVLDIENKTGYIKAIFTDGSSTSKGKWFSDIDLTLNVTYDTEKTINSNGKPNYDISNLVITGVRTWPSNLEDEDGNQYALDLWFDKLSWPLSDDYSYVASMKIHAYEFVGIANNAFENAQGIDFNVNFTNGENTIGASLPEDLGNTIYYFREKDNIQTIGDAAFKNSNLKKANFNKNCAVKSLGCEAFKSAAYDFSTPIYLSNNIVYLDGEVFGPSDTTNYSIVWDTSGKGANQFVVDNNNGKSNPIVPQNNRSDSYTRDLVFFNSGDMENYNFNELPSLAIYDNDIANKIIEIANGSEPTSLKWKDAIFLVSNPKTEMYQFYSKNLETWGLGSISGNNALMYSINSKFTPKTNMEYTPYVLREGQDGSTTEVTDTFKFEYVKADESSSSNIVYDTQKLKWMVKINANPTIYYGSVTNFQLGWKDNANHQTDIQYHWKIYKLDSYLELSLVDNPGTYYNDGEVKIKARFDNLKYNNTKINGLKFVIYEGQGTSGRVLFEKVGNKTPTINVDNQFSLNCSTPYEDANSPYDTDVDITINRNGANTSANTFNNKYTLNVIYTPDAIYDERDWSSSGNKNITFNYDYVGILSKGNTVSSYRNEATEQVIADIHNATLSNTTPVSLTVKDINQQVISSSKYNISFNVSSNQLKANVRYNWNDSIDKTSKYFFVEAKFNVTSNVSSVTLDNDAYKTTTFVWNINRTEGISFDKSIINSIAYDPISLSGRISSKNDDAVINATDLYYEVYDLEGNNYTNNFILTNINLIDKTSFTMTITPNALFQNDKRFIIRVASKTSSDITGNVLLTINNTNIQLDVFDLSNEGKSVLDTGINADFNAKSEYEYDVEVKNLENIKSENLVATVLYQNKPILKINGNNKVLLNDNENIFNPTAIKFDKWYKNTVRMTLSNLSDIISIYETHTVSLKLDYNNDNVAADNDFRNQNVVALINMNLDTPIWIKSTDNEVHYYDYSKKDKGIISEFTIPFEIYSWKTDSLTNIDDLSQFDFKLYDKNGEIVLTNYYSVEFTKDDTVENKFYAHVVINSVFASFYNLNGSLSYKFQYEIDWSHPTTGVNYKLVNNFYLKNKSLNDDIIILSCSIAALVLIVVFILASLYTYRKYKI